MKLFPKAVPFCPTCPARSKELEMKLHPSFNITPPNKKVETKVVSIVNRKKTRQKNGLF